jgi:O-acetyl-ADP-ribose deacetylase (regulator of RNase III)
VNKVLVERVLSTGQILQIVQGDLTAETTDAIVNAANEHLAHGGGVAWTIVRRGGEIIQQESDEWIRKHGTVSHARPAWTSSGNLPAKYVIHAVGPVWGDPERAQGVGNEDEKLAAAVNGSLEVADELKCSSISLPAISTGIFGFPKERAADIIFSAIERYFLQHESGIKLIRVVLFDDSTLQAFMSNWSNRSDKSYKSEKSDKSEKSHKSDKSYKSEKSNL